MIIIRNVFTYIYILAYIDVKTFPTFFIFLYKNAFLTFSYSVFNRRPRIVGGEARPAQRSSLNPKPPKYTHVAFPCISRPHLVLRCCPALFHLTSSNLTLYSS